MQLEERKPELTKELRKWQQEAVDAFKAASTKHFLLVASPGTGKTVAAINMILDLARDGTKVVIVAPSLRVCQQWKNVAHGYGIVLGDDPVYASCNASYNGFVMTYQALLDISTTQHLIRNLGDLVIVFDEIHHTSTDGRAWGRNAELIGDMARRTILLSGTPYRSDGYPLALCEYDEAGQAIPGYQISRWDALTQRAINAIDYKMINATAEWCAQGELFSRELDAADNDENRALASAIWSESMIRHMVTSANESLLRRRSGSPEAKGLILAANIKHAEMIRDCIKKDGIRAVVVASDDSDALSKLDGFPAAHEVWMIAVEMVREGVDVYGLKELVYLTNKTTQLFFDQASGRVCRRWHANDSAFAHVWLPDTPTLKGHATTYMEQVPPAIRDQIEAGGGGGGGGPVQSSVQYLGTSDEWHSATIGPDRVLGPAVLSQIQVIRSRMPNHLDASDTLIAAVSEATHSPTASVAVLEEPPVHPDVERKNLRKACQSRVRVIVKEENERGRLNDVTYSKVWGLVHAATDNRNLPDATKHGLQMRLAVLNEWIVDRQAFRTAYIRWYCW
jgi:superfamily II DNA or RNA helicase